jgi:hypothetical protein
MSRGKSICNVLKTIRKQVADANGIEYEPRECHHQGDCRGTCPACEAEVRYIQQQLDIRRQLGKAVAVVGISASLAALSGCTNKSKNVDKAEVISSQLTEGKVARPSANDSICFEDEVQYTGMVSKDSSDMVPIPKTKSSVYFVPPELEGDIEEVQEHEDTTDRNLSPSTNN